MSSTKHVTVASLALGLGWATSAGAQPTDPYAGARTATPPSATTESTSADEDIARAREQAAQARTRAAKSRELASCLRPAAGRVDLAARALAQARQPAARAKRQAELDRALSGMRACYDTLFDGGGPSPDRCRDELFDGDGRVPPECASAIGADQRTLHGRTSFGQIRVAEGISDAASVGGALRERIGQLQSCQDQAIARTGAVQGEIDISLLLPASQGRATPFGVGMRNARVGNEAMRRCIATTLMGTAFPASPRGALVDLRLMLSTEPGPAPRARAARP